MIDFEFHRDVELEKAVVLSPISCFQFPFLDLLGPCECGLSMQTGGELVLRGYYDGDTLAKNKRKQKKRFPLVADPTKTR